MKSIVLHLVLFFTGMIALGFGLLWISRLTLEYNSEGRYFDEEAGVVYHEDGVMFYALLTALSGVTFMVILVVHSRRNARKQ